MKFFAAVKLATFATALFEKAGLNLEQLHAAADENALKNLLGKDSETETALAEATTENARIAGELAQAKKDLTAITEGRAALAAVATPLTAALEAKGITLAACSDAAGAFSAEKFNAAIEAQIEQSATLKLSASGHPPVAHNVDTSAAAPVHVGADGKPLTGVALTTAMLAAGRAAAKPAAK